jgi:hypothetical protein
MRQIALISVVFAGISLVGCTMIQMSHYISPAAPGATLSRGPLSPDLASIYSGPANSLRLETDRLRLGFACWNDGYTPLLIGPFVLPVLPIVILSPILREPLKTDPLKIAVHLEPIGEPVAFTPGRVEVVDAHGTPLQIREIRSGPGRPPRVSDSVYVPPKNELSTEDTVVVTEPSLFVLQFAASNTVGSRFRVAVNGVTHSGSSLALPAIELTVASGVELQLGP